jgi:hypothetical protein
MEEEKETLSEEEDISDEAVSIRHERVLRKMREQWCINA